MARCSSTKRRTRRRSPAPSSSRCSHTQSYSVSPSPLPACRPLKASGLHGRSLRGASLPASLAGAPTRSRAASAPRPCPPAAHSKRQACMAAPCGGPACPRAEQVLPHAVVQRQPLAPARLPRTQSVRPAWQRPVGGQLARELSRCSHTQSCSVSPSPLPACRPLKASGLHGRSLRGASLPASLAGAPTRSRAASAPRPCPPAAHSKRQACMAAPCGGPACPRAEQVLPHAVVQRQPLAPARLPPTQSVRPARQVPAGGQLARELSRCSHTQSCSVSPSPLPACRALKTSGLHASALWGPAS